MLLDIYKGGLSDLDGTREESSWPETPGSLAALEQVPTPRQELYA